MLRVLLVCTGNICRSPLAHGFLLDRSDRLLDGAIEVRSAGTWARDGAPATPDGVAAGAEAGIDIAGHRATRFHPAIARWADLVVTMTAEQRDEVLQEEPSVGPRTFTLKELVGVLRDLPAPDGTVSRASLLARIQAADRLRREGGARSVADPDVADPLGMSPMTYRMVAAEIEGLIEALLRGLIPDRAAAGAREG